MKKNRNSNFSSVFDPCMSDDTPQANRELQLDENDPVWQLLARAPRLEPDAWFTVRTLARCRHVGLGTDYRSIFFNRTWRWALGGGLGLCLAAMVLTNQSPFHFAFSSDQKNVQEAFQIMASLGMDSDSPSSAQDSSL